MNWTTSSLLIPLHFLWDIWQLTTFKYVWTISCFSFGIFLGHFPSNRGSPIGCWERQLPQYRTLHHSVELLPSSVLHQYRVLLNFTAILPMLSIWVLPVDYGVVRKSTLQKSHYSLILRLGADPAATPSFLCRQNQFCSADLSNANGPKKGQKFRKGKKNTC